MELSKQQDGGTASVAHLPKEQKTNQANLIVEQYVEKRRDKAEEQAQKEEEEITQAKQTKSNWDELISYRYAIF
ncbi:hypothetical protein [Pedobacter sp. Hv1]|uniref:hypothetical protein n=1 Tax=Pedobacter sp. Hv1 TaxID=1740090 RepID=UPI0006D8CEAE|nr:hypothetical protein [Pedobacter sp. Hv1]KQB99045.1 hypothetical protein AQF98_20170 [Pedobacter sp. Hv1]